MKLFAQIRKVDEARRLVFGRAAEEVVDKADEIMDYATSKPYFEKWSKDIAKDTDGKSLGNVRAMHGKVAAGKLTGIDFNDAEKAIDICAKVVDDNEWSKVLEGVYRGFSVGGAYVEGSKKVEKLDDKSVTRYTAAPSEISLVDSPCIPTAKFFEVQKADGTLAKVDFKEPAAEADAGTINGTPEQVDALVKAMNAEGVNLADLLEKALPAFIADKKKKKEEADAKDGKDGKDAKDTKKEAGKAAPAGELQKLEQGALRKSMYSCSSFAEVIGSLQSLQRSAEYEAFYEGDTSGIGKKLAACIAMCAQCLKDMIDEECAECCAAGGTPDGAVMEMAEKTGALAKFEGDPIAALLKIGARNSAADKERLAKIHDMAVELGHDCGAAKAAPAGDLTKIDAGAAFEKMLADAVAPLQKAITDAGELAKAQAEKIKKLEEQPAPARVALRAIDKSEDTGAAPIEKTNTPITDAHGEKHDAAGLIKSLHQSGGAPLLKL